MRKSQSQRRKLRARREAKKKDTELLPERVPFAAKPREDLDARDIRSWTSRAVWTDRMLSTLVERRLKHGKWHSLIDKVTSELNLFQAARKVTAKDGAAGVDGQDCEAFEEGLIVETRKLGGQITGGHYTPSPVRRVHIPKPGTPNQTRPLGIPTVRDRVVQTALVHVIEPILDNEFHERSFGFRHGRSAHDALRIVEQKIEEGYVYVVAADLKGYFDSIPRGKLMRLLKQHIADSKVIELIEAFLGSGIMEDLHLHNPIAGVPQGAVLSPVLSNLYLNDLDHTIAGEGFEMVRYADDFVVLCRSEFEAEVALEEIKRWVKKAGLTLHSGKTKIVDSREKSFVFLGYSFRGDKIYPRAESLSKMKSRIVELTQRKRPDSIQRIALELSRVLRGWFAYFRHCRWTIFKDLDAKIRGRLRRLLLQRHRKNPARLPRTQRWPNAYFTAAGLYSLREAHNRFAQSLSGAY
ncbi:Group II intron-encoded protein LtrA [Rosistilla ulvae]|uniref:Group II intron-encoded protein LtrA n=2 Tax=Rosistilla ulvae TaxID=1930277 RepID=A0A517LVV2_9BACT|nr:Group II intron-encoded protein LtrA [Rosistilla ulvae]